MALSQLYSLWGKEIPALVITADRTDLVTAEISDFGAQLLNKPIKPAALRAMINKLIAGSKA
jgi:DNA-binding response OmpR family regulator